MSAKDPVTLQRLEESLWRAPTRFDRDYMEEVLAADFFEFGRSGRLWSRNEVITTEAREIGVELPLADLAVHLVGPDVALVTYRTVVTGAACQDGNRTSVWRRTGSSWELVFHVGAPTSF